MTCPTLTLVGEEDILIYPTLSRAAARRDPQFDVGEVPGGHACLWEYPDEFNRAVLDFLQRRSARGLEELACVVRVEPELLLEAVRRRRRDRRRRSPISASEWAPGRLTSRSWSAGRRPSHSSAPATRAISAGWSSSRSATACGRTIACSSACGRSYAPPSTWQIRWCSPSRDRERGRGEERAPQRGRRVACAEAVASARIAPSATSVSADSRQVRRALRRRGPSRSSRSRRPAPGQAREEVGVVDDEPRDDGRRRARSPCAARR